MTGPISLLTGDWTQWVTFVLLVGGLLGAIGLHEYGHALAADLQGDRLPRAMGRLSLNPARHLDPLGTLLIVLVGFGWGKPVEFRPQALSSQRFGSAIVALAGPFMNVALALASSVLFRGALAVDAPGFALNALFIFAALNLLLAVFNLLPIPPLDGSRLLTIFLPPRHQKIVFFLDRYGFMILLVLFLFGQVAFLDPVFDFALQITERLTGLA